MKVEYSGFICAGERQGSAPIAVCQKGEFLPHIMLDNHRFLSA